jgi:hypothetical protein
MDTWKWLGIGGVILLVFFEILLAFVGMAMWADLELGNIFAGVQAVTGACLAPIAIFGFILTYRQLVVNNQQLEITLDQLQRNPKVDLYLADFTKGNVVSEDLTKEGVLIKPKKDSTNSPHKVFLLNRGKRIGLWYMVVITAPLELDPSFIPSLGRLATNKADGKLTEVDVEKTRVFTFRSDGEYGIYTDYPLDFGILQFFIEPDRRYQPTYEATYVITNDWGKPVEGTLVLRVVET